MRFRATAFHSRVGPPALCQKIAMCVCSGVRVALFTEPSALTSLKSSAHAALLSACGPSVRNCEELCIANGRPPPTHGVGSRIGVPSGFISGCQCPDGTPLLPPTPWVGGVRPFLMQSSSQFRTDGPQALSSAAWAEDFNEVKALGSVNSATRTPEQTHIAIFWQSAGGPSLLWNGV